MTPPLDLLLAEGTLTFNPRTGEFDTDAVAKAVAGIGSSYHDKADPTVFALFVDPEAREACRAARAADPNDSYPYVPLLTVHPHEIMLFTAGSDAPLLALAGQFITWLTSAYDCRIENEFGTDMEAVEQAEKPQG
jgi:hypothetical protein